MRINIIKNIIRNKQARFLLILILVSLLSLVSVSAIPTDYIPGIGEEFIVDKAQGNITLKIFFLFTSLELDIISSNIFP